MDDLFLATFSRSFLGVHRNFLLELSLELFIATFPGADLNFLPATFTGRTCGLLQSQVSVMVPSLMFPQKIKLVFYFPSRVIKHLCLSFFCPPTTNPPRIFYLPVSHIDNRRSFKIFWGGTAVLVFTSTACSPSGEINLAYFSGKPSPNAFIALINFSKSSSFLEREEMGVRRIPRWIPDKKNMAEIGSLKV